MPWGAGAVVTLFGVALVEFVLDGAQFLAPIAGGLGGAAHTSGFGVGRRRAGARGAVRG
ncbi:hypothetical protein GZL_06321 [Streptomyces sp. 769]|nr:hypothetical protein GZL_06321 [Streptomyces sp. 769]